MRAQHFIEGFQGMGMELIYSFVIIAISLMIYFSTKELYELSSHKGIKYFRMSFLFFAVAFFFRSFTKFLLMLFDIPRLFPINPVIFPIISFIIFHYAITMAIFLLIYSAFWKKLEDKYYLFYIFNTIAIFIPIITIVSTSQNFFLISQIMLIIFIAISIYFAYSNSKNKKRMGNLCAVYILLFIFSILNIIDIVIPGFLSLFQILIYIASISIFLGILYKVLKNIN